MKNREKWNKPDGEKKKLTLIENYQEKTELKQESQLENRESPEVQ